MPEQKWAAYKVMQFSENLSAVYCLVWNCDLSWNSIVSQIEHKKTYEADEDAKRFQIFKESLQFVEGELDELNDHASIIHTLWPLF